MKKILLSLTVTILVGCVFLGSGCYLLELIPADNAQYDCFWANRDIEVGGVWTWTNDNTLYVQVFTGDWDGRSSHLSGWEMTAIQVAAAYELSEIPQNEEGTPITGDFPIIEDFSSEPITKKTYTFSLDELPGSYADDIYVAVHAIVQHPDFSIHNAWGDCNPFPCPEWAKYIVYKGELVLPANAYQE